MAKVRYWCDDLPWKDALGECRDFPPSYPVGTERQYKQSVAEAKQYLDDPEMFYAAGHRRQAHLMLPGGRTKLRYPRRDWPKDKQKGGPREQGQPRTEASWKRLLGAEAPWDARTQSPRSRGYGWGEEAMAAKNPHPKQSLEGVITQAIERWRQVHPEGESGFRVPRQKETLIAAGFPPKVAWLLVSRAGGKLLLAGTDATQQVNPFTQLSLAMGTPLRLIEDYADGMPKPRIVAGVGMQDFGYRGVTVEAIEIVNGWTGEAETYLAKVLIAQAKNPRKPSTLALVLDDVVRGTWEDEDWNGAPVRMRVVTKAGVIADVSIGEHSSFWRKRAAQTRPDYRTFQNVTLAELPAVLVRLAQHKEKKTGRRLLPLNPSESDPEPRPSKENSMAKKARKNKGDPWFGTSVRGRNTQYDYVEGPFGAGFASPAVNRRNRGAPRKRARKSGYSPKQLAAGFGGAALKKAARAGKLKNLYRGAAASKSKAPKRRTSRKTLPAALRRMHPLAKKAMKLHHSAGISLKTAWARVMKGR